MMFKRDAIALFGGVAQTASALGILKSAVYGWPEVLSDRIAQRVVGAAMLARVKPEDIQQALGAYKAFYERHSALYRADDESMDE